MSKREKERDRQRENEKEGSMRKDRTREGDREELKTHGEEWKGVDNESETQRSGRASKVLCT